MIIGNTVGAGILRRAFGDYGGFLVGCCDWIVQATSLAYLKPNLPRPFKVLGYQWSNLGVPLASAAFLVASVAGDLTDALFTLLLLVRKDLPPITPDAVVVPPE